MAFVSRAPRFQGPQSAFSQKTGGGDIGPGAYEVSDKWSIGKVKHSQAPFSSTSSRGLTSKDAKRKQNMVTPGPGSYKTDWVTSIAADTTRSSRVPSAAFVSQSQRFNTPSDPSGTPFTGGSSSKDGGVGRGVGGVPGPGTYEMPDQWAKKRPQSSPDIKTRRRLKEQNVKKSLQWGENKSVPSIPAPSQSYGYEEDHTGKLVMQKPPEEFVEATYDPRVEYESRHRRGPMYDFSRSKGREEAKMKKEITPGPGSYNIRSSIGEEAQENEGGKQGGLSVRAALDKLLPKRPSAAFASTSKRNGLVNRNQIDTPAPGSYNIDVDSIGARAQKSKVPDYLQNFGSGQSRAFHTDSLLERATSGPGPGQYDVNSSLKGSMGGAKFGGVGGAKGKEEKVKGAVFGTSPRFVEDRKKPQLIRTVPGGPPTDVEEHTEAPGPGVYDTSNYYSIGASVERKSRVGAYGVFGSTSKRFGGGGGRERERERDVERELGPGTYDIVAIEDKRRERERRKPSSMFRSKAPRFGDKERERERDSGPAPGQYDLPVEKSVGGGPKLVRSKEVGVGFGTSGSRFSAKRKDSKDTLPGPGQYEVSTSIDAVHSHGQNLRSPVKGPFGSRAKRFEERKVEAAPGPGAYEPDNVYTRMVKRSFNSTIEGDMLYNY